MNKYKTIREQAYESNMQLPALGLVFSTFGNVSVADRDKGVFAIKPSGLAYDKLSPENMVIVDFEANVIEGDLRPSSDTKTHAVLYKYWENIGAVVHTHSKFATSWAQTLRDIPIYGTTHADYLTTDIPCASPMADDKIIGNYEYETGFQVLNHFKEHRLKYEEVEMILVGSHGPFSWGKTGEKAVFNSALLEYVAELAFITEQISPEVGRLKKSLIDKHWQRKHGANSYYGQ